MPKSIRCVVVNSTDFELKPSLDKHTKLNFALDNGAFAAGTKGDPPSPPLSIPSKGQGTFTMTGPASGWVCWELEEVKTVVSVGWGDATLGAHAFWVSGNRYTTPYGCPCGEVKLEDDACHALTPDQATSADNLVVTFTISLAPAVAPPVHAAPDATCKVAKASGLDWAENLDPRRKKLLATLAAITPQKIHATPSTTASPGEVCTLYNQGGIWLSSDSWWTYWVDGPDLNPNYKDDQPKPDPHTDPTGNHRFKQVSKPELATTTNCTGFNPLVMGRYYGPGYKNNGFKGSYLPGGYHWAFAIGGKDTGSTQLDGGHMPGWMLAKDNLKSKPKPGDTYLVWNDYTGSEPAGVAHVGIIVYVPDPNDPDDCWVMADGGQGGRGAQTCNLVWGLIFLAQETPPKGDGEPKQPLNDITIKRVMPAVITYPGAPYICGGVEGTTAPRRLQGWVNLEDPGLKPRDEVTDKELEAMKPDLQDMVRRINNVRNYFKANEAEKCRRAMAAGLVFNPAGTRQKLTPLPWT